MSKQIRSMVVDGAGALYMAGQTNAIDFPATAGVVQPARAGSFDTFIAQAQSRRHGDSNTSRTSAAPATTSRIPCVSMPPAMPISRAQTSSVDFPTTAGAAQTVSAAHRIVFVAKLNATGGALLYSTYLGGIGG